MHYASTEFACEPSSRASVIALCFKSLGECAMKVRVMVHFEGCLAGMQ